MKKVIKYLKRKRIKEVETLNLQKTWVGNTEAHIKKIDELLRCLEEIK